MKLIRKAIATVSRFFMKGLAVLATLVRPGQPTALVVTPLSRPEERPRMRALWIVLATVVGLGMMGLAGAFAFIYSGIYDIAAYRPHLEITNKVLTLVKRRSVEFHARDLIVPELDDADLIQRGFVLYRDHCVSCHGAPGEARAPMGVGVNPNPPPLEKAVEDWSHAEVAWITAYGLKMAGMPAFGLGKGPLDLWAITAFVKRLNTLPPEEYRNMVAATRGEYPMAEIRWLPENQGWELLEQRSDDDRGRRLVEYYGCTSCHRIPGAPGLQAMSGPPLHNWRVRHYISGRWVNNPINLARWIQNPQAMDPKTAMPNVGVTEEDAWAIAGFLYTLE